MFRFQNRLSANVSPCIGQEEHKPLFHGWQDCFRSGLDTTPSSPHSHVTHTKLRALQGASLKLSRKTEEKQTLYIWKRLNRLPKPQESMCGSYGVLKLQWFFFPQNVDMNCDTCIHTTYYSDTKTDILYIHTHTHSRHTHIPLLIAAIIKGIIWISKTWMSYLGDTWNVRPWAIEQTDCLCVWCVCVV